MEEILRLKVFNKLFSIKMYLFNLGPNSALGKFRWYGMKQFRIKKTRIRRDNSQMTQTLSLNNNNALLKIKNRVIKEYYQSFLMGFYKSILAFYLIKYQYLR